MKKDIRSRIYDLSKGISLIEILVVITVFAILAILATRGIYLTLHGGRKSEATTNVRENLDYSVAVMERRLRNAKSATCASATRVDYQDKDFKSTYFSCESVGTDGYIASDSARITSEDVSITSCTFTCSAEGGGVPSSVSVSVTGKDKNTQGAGSATVTVSTRIFLRNY